MADDAKKTDETPAAGDAPSGGSKAITWLIVLVLVIIAVQVVYILNNTKNKATTVPAGPQPGIAQQAPGGPASPAGSTNPANPANPATAPVPGGPGTGVTTVGPQGKSARTGNIDWPSLCYGLVKLDKTPQKLKADQAKKLLVAVTQFDAETLRDTYYETVLAKILTDGQKTFMRRKEKELGMDKLDAAATLEKKKAVLEELKKIAGIQTAADVPVPAGFTRPPVPTPGAFLEALLWACFDEMQKDDTLKITSAQAKSLLPLVESYVAVAQKGDIGNQILLVLTLEQKGALDKAVTQMVKEKPDWFATQNALKKMLKERSGAK